MIDIVMLHRSLRARERLTRAVRTDGDGLRCRPHFVESWSSAVDAVMGSRAPVLVTQAYENGGLVIDRAISLGERVPRLDVVVYGDFAGRSTAEIPHHLPAEVSAVLTLDENDSPAQIRWLLFESVGRQRMAHSMGSVRGVLSATALSILSIVLENSMRPLTPDVLGRMLSRTPRSLNRLFHRLCLLPPAHTIAWCRAIHALRLIQVGCSLEGAARIMDFSSGAALRRSLSQLAGESSVSVMRARGLDAAARLLTDRLVEARRRFRTVPASAEFRQG